MCRIVAAILVVVLLSPLCAAQNGLKLSELLYQPASGEAEYLEFYNDSDVAIDLADYHIVRVLHDTLATHYPLPSHSVAPRHYAVVSKDVASVIACFDVRHVTSLVQCNLPPYPNDGGSVVLATADSVVVERFDYSPAMHSPLLHNRAGVALERRSFSRPVSQSDNWFSASSVSGYGTPGYANSQSTEWLVAETAFRLSSSVVSPDGDGYHDVLVVEYAMERADLLADMSIVDASGHTVAQLLGAALLGTHGNVEWDAAGVPQGRYLLLVTVYDTGGRRQVLRRVVSVVNAQ